MRRAKEGSPAAVDVDYIRGVTHVQLALCVLQDERLITVTRVVERTHRSFKANVIALQRMKKFSKEPDRHVQGEPAFPF